MKDLNYPKVLVVGINPWIDNTGINTLISFFEGWHSDSIAHLYTRDKLPNTRICKCFFRISECDVLQSTFKRKLKTGRVVFNGENNQSNASIRETQLYTKKRSTVMSFAREVAWLLGKWKSDELNHFLDTYNADVLFFPIYSNVYMNRLQNYIQRYTKKPSVLYVSDDNYSYQSVNKTLISLFLRFWARKQEKKLFASASRVMVISPKQKEEYDVLFGIDSVIMTKGIDFSKFPFCETPVNHPIKMVYTGKLIIGRWLSLAKIAEVLGEINQNGIKAELDIYTTDHLTEEQSRALNRNGCSVKGALTLDEVQKVQAEADILVFVESLEKKYRYTARLSFSTKITDYLKSGKCIFAIGDKDIAPIDYFKRYDSAVTVTTYDEIADKLKMLLEHSTMITEYGQKAYMCGKEHHNIELMNKTLVDTICNALENSGVQHHENSTN